MNHQRWAEEQRLFRHHMDTLEDEIREKLGGRYLVAFKALKHDADRVAEFRRDLEHWNEIAREIELIGDVNDPDADPYDAVILWLKRNRSILYKRVRSRSTSPE